MNKIIEQVLLENNNTTKTLKQIRTELVYILKDYPALSKASEYDKIHKYISNHFDNIVINDLDVIADYGNTMINYFKSNSISKEDAVAITPCVFGKLIHIRECE